MTRASPLRPRPRPPQRPRPRRRWWRASLTSRQVSRRPHPRSPTRRRSRRRRSARQGYPFLRRLRLLPRASHRSSRASAAVPRPSARGAAPPCECATRRSGTSFVMSIAHPDRSLVRYANAHPDRSPLTPPPSWIPSISPCPWPRQRALPPP